MISFNSADITINEGYPFCVDNIYGRRPYLMDPNAYYKITFDTTGIDICHNVYPKLLHVSTDGISCSLTNDSTNSQFSVLAKYPTNSEVPYTQTNINTDIVMINSVSGFNLNCNSGYINIIGKKGTAIGNGNGDFITLVPYGTIIDGYQTDIITLKAANGSMALYADTDISLTSKLGSIGLNGTVKINGTLLEDMIGAGSSVDLSNYVTKSELEVNLYKDDNMGITLGSGPDKSGPYAQYYANPNGNIITAKTFNGDISVIKNVWSSVGKDAAINDITRLIKPDDSDYYGVVGISADAFIIKPTVDEYDTSGELNSLPSYEFSREYANLTAIWSINLESVIEDINIKAGTQEAGQGTVSITGGSVIIGDKDTHTIEMGNYFTAPVYTENDNGSYTKTNKKVSLRVVERDGAYTIVIDDD